MAAFCICCGTEITRRVEACPICGTPRHGMLPELPDAQVAGENSLPDDLISARKLRDSQFYERPETQISPEKRASRK